MKTSKLTILTLSSVLALAFSISLTGCGETPPPTSPVVSPESEEGKKALAEDEAARQVLKQKEAKASSRSRKAHLPDEG